MPPLILLNVNDTTWVPIDPHAITLKVSCMQLISFWQLISEGEMLPSLLGHPVWDMAIVKSLMPPTAERVVLIAALVTPRARLLGKVSKVMVRAAAIVIATFEGTA